MVTPTVTPHAWWTRCNCFFNYVISRTKRLHSFNLIFRWFISEQETSFKLYFSEKDDVNARTRENFTFKSWQYVWVGSNCDSWRSTITIRLLLNLLFKVVLITFLFYLFFELKQTTKNFYCAKLYACNIVTAFKSFNECHCSTTGALLSVQTCCKIKQHGRRTWYYVNRRRRRI